MGLLVRFRIALKNLPQLRRTRASVVLRGVFILLALLHSGLSETHAGNPPPAITVPRVSLGPKLDGLGKDPVWTRAVTFELTDPWNQEEADPASATRVSLLHDGEFLYVAFDCGDPDIRAIRTARNDQTFRDDCVEIFIGAARERLSDTVGLEINALGTLSDFYYRHSDWINHRYQSGAVVEVSREPRLPGISGYRVEASIPFAKLHAITTSPGPDWEGASFPPRLRANFARWDRGSQDRLSIWADPGYSFPHPHNPERYGWLDLAETETLAD